MISLSLLLFWTKRWSFYSFPKSQPELSVDGHWAVICGFRRTSTPQNRLVPARLGPAEIYAKISRIKLPHPRLPSNNPDTSLWELGPGESDKHLRNNGQDFYLICTRKRVNIWTKIKKGPQIKLDYLGIVPVKGEGGVFIPILFLVTRALDGEIFMITKCTCDLYSCNPHL